MAHSTTIQASAYLLKQLANPAARALLLASAAGLALTAFRVRATSVRLFTWTAVLYAALALPLLSWVLPQVPIPAPAFLQNVFSEQASPLASEEIQPADVRSECNDAEAGTAARGCPGEESSTLVFVGTAKSSGRHEQVASAQLSHGASEQASLPSRKNREASSAISSVPLLPRSFESAPLAAAAIYLAMTLLLLVRILVGLVLNRRLMGASHPIDDPRITLRLAEFAHAAGMTSIPSAAESECISVPVTMGALQSLILLPTSWREWDDAKLDAVVAHEASHVARRDALTQHLSLLHRAIFLFSPLVWWLHRQLAGLAEQAADEATLSCGADRKQYARILLGFFEALHAAPERVWWQGVSMAKAGQAEERLERI